MLRRLVYSLAVLVVLSVWASAATAQATPDFNNQSYGAHFRNRIDIYLPPGITEPAPCVLYIHGGGWLVGDKSQVADHVDELLARGLVVAAANYRFSQNATFPAQAHDIKAAIRFLRGNAGTLMIDPQRIAVFGESAGGHLAALMATTNGNTELEGTVGSFPAESSDVYCAVDFFGPSDIFGMGVHNPSCTSEDSLLIGICISEVIANLGDPAYDLWFDLINLASPVFHVTADDVPIRIAHGEDDTLVPLSQSSDFYTLLVNAGVEVVFNSYPGVEHDVPLAEDIAAYDWLQQQLFSLRAPDTFDVPGDYGTIQEAIDNGVDGDVIIVAPGSYNEVINFNGLDLTLRASGGPASTTIDGATLTSSVVTFAMGETASAVLQGFTISGGNPVGDGGGILCDGASPTIVNCIVTANTATNGAGLANQNSAAPTLIGCLLYGNNASTGLGGGVFNGAGCNPSIDNSTIAANQADEGGGIYNQTSASPEIENTIIWGNTAATQGTAVWNDGTSTPTFASSNIEGSGGSLAWIGTFGSDLGGNLAIDPRYVNALGGDFSLDRFSPCIDAGDNALLPLDATDIDDDLDTAEVIPLDLSGNTRQFDDLGVADSGNGTAPLADMGAIERQTESLTTTFNITSGQSIQAVLSSAVDGDTINVGPGTYSELINVEGKAVTLRSTDGPASTIIDGTAFSGSVVSFSNDGGGSATFIGFTVVGGSPSARDGDGSGIVVENASPLIADCIVTGNAGVNGAGIRCTTAGPTIINCTIDSNTATGNGGGLRCESGSNPIVSNCLFTGNAADNGGAISNDGSAPTIINCTIAGNTATNIGGGLDNINASPSITNTIVYGNIAASDDNLANDPGSTPVIAYSNIAGSGGSGGWVSAYGTDNGGNVDASPRFTDAGNGDFSLQRFSPCIDAADNTALLLDPADLDQDLDTAEVHPIDLAGNARQFDDAGVADAGNGTAPLADMGAFERQADSQLMNFVVQDGQSIQAAIDLAFDGEQVLVEAGTYNEALDLQGKAIMLISQSGPQLTTIDGSGLTDSTIVCVNGEDADTVIEGFTIANADHGMNGGAMRLFNASPTIRYCIFRKNSTGADGGAMALQAASNPSIINCQFNGNSAVNGGAISNALSSPLITQCTFTNNTAINMGGAIRNQDSGPTIRNSIIAGNSAPTGPEIHNNGLTSPGIAGSLVLGSGGSANWQTDFGVDEGDNRDGQPQFVDADGVDDVIGSADDNLALLGGSPAIDAGVNVLLPGDVTIDLASMPRVLDGNFDTVATVDCGAYEFDVAGGLPIVINLTKTLNYSTIAQAIAGATAGDDLLATAQAFLAEPSIDFDDLAIDLASTAGISQAAGGLISMSDGSELAAASGNSIQLAGDLTVAADAAADLVADSVITDASSQVTVRAQSGLYVTTTSLTLNGELDVLPGGLFSTSHDLLSTGNLVLLDTATLSVGNELTNQGTISALDADLSLDALTNEGSITTANTDVVASLFTNSPEASMSGYGNIFADVINDGTITIIGDTTVVGDFTNNDATTVQIGVLTIVGALTNNGSIVGEVVNARAAGSRGGQSQPVTMPGDGLAVQSHYITGTDAYLLLPDSLWRLAVQGNFDVAINDHQRFDLSRATLVLNAGPGHGQTIEIMSEDVGPDPIGLDRTLPGHYPIGTLRLAAGSTVTMVDAYDNDGLGQGTCEAIYVDVLDIEAGATLVTGSCKVYYNSLVLDGSIDVPANVQPIMYAPPCTTDVAPDPVDGDGLWGDGVTGLDDFFALLQHWGSCPVEGDCPWDCAPVIDAGTWGDGEVGLDDFFLLLQNWGACDP
jgi:parallel beta-helix repeat protein